jgi:hypothetical protein
VERPDILPGIDILKMLCAGTATANWTERNGTTFRSLLLESRRNVTVLNFATEGSITLSANLACTFEHGGAHHAAAPPLRTEGPRPSAMLTVVALNEATARSMRALGGTSVFYAAETDAGVSEARTLAVNQEVAGMAHDATVISSAVLWTRLMLTRLRILLAAVATVPSGRVVLLSDSDVVLANGAAPSALDRDLTLRMREVDAVFMREGGDDRVALNAGFTSFRGSESSEVFLLWWLAVAATVREMPDARLARSRAPLAAVTPYCLSHPVARRSSRSTQTGTSRMFSIAC